MKPIFFERSSACKCLCIAVLAKFILRVAVSSSRMDALTSRVFSSNAGFSRWRIFAFASSHFLSTSFNVFKDSFSRVSESTENDFSLVVSLCATCILCRMFSRVSCSALTNFSMALKRTSAFRSRWRELRDRRIFNSHFTFDKLQRVSDFFGRLSWHTRRFCSFSIQFFSVAQPFSSSLRFPPPTRESLRVCARPTDSLSSLFAIHDLLCSLASSVFVFCSRSLFNRFSTSSFFFLLQPFVF